MKRFFSLAFVLLLFIGQASAEDGYDPNTEVAVSGVIKEVLDTERGAVRFLLETESRQYTIVTGPWWYLDSIGLTLQAGMRVQVTGSKLYNRRGELLIITYTLETISDRKTYRFRDDNLLPLWRGGRKGKF